MAGAEEALARLARDLVEEIAAARAVELAASPQALELAAQVRPFTRQPRQGPEEHDPGAGPSWARSQQDWKARGDSLWGGQRFADLHPQHAEGFTQAAEKAHGHLTHPDGPELAKGYEQLHEAHRIAAEELLPRAETDAQKESVRDSITHVRDRMKEIDKAASVRSARTARLTGSVPERARRAAEKLDNPVHPQVTVPEVKLPPAPSGAAAVHTHLGLRHVTPLAGDTMSGFAHRHVPQPFPAAAVSPEAGALQQANARLDQYAQREEKQRESDLRDHLGDLKKAEQEMKASKTAAGGQAPEGTYRPLDDDQYALHQRDATDKVHQALAKGRATSQSHSADGGISYAPGRALAHDEILRDFTEKHTGVPSSRQAMLLGGLPSAGKRAVWRGGPGVDPRDYAHVSPDYFKDELARRGLVPEVAGLSPAESGALAHDEAGHLSQMAVRLLAERGKNIALDTDMGRQQDVLAYLEHLRGRGYTPHAVFTDTPAERAAAEAARAHRTGLEGYRQGTGTGGRLAGGEHLLSAETEPGTTAHRQAFESLKPHFSTWQHWDNRDGRPRVAGKSEEQPGHGIPSVEELLRQKGFG